MRVDERRLGGMLEQLRDQQASLRDTQIADAIDVHARVEHLAPRARMHMDERALHRQEALELLLGVAIVAERNAGMESRVAAGPAFDMSLEYRARMTSCFARSASFHGIANLPKSLQTLGNKSREAGQQILGQALTLRRHLTRIDASTWRDLVTVGQKVANS